jgi:hypothetical protein
VVVLVAEGGAAADALVATHSPQAVVISRVSGARVTPVLTHKVAAASYAWSAADTLWVAYGNAAALSVDKIVDGKVADTIELRDLATVVPGKDVPSGTEQAPGLVVAKGGQVFVSTCLSLRAARDGMMHCNYGYTRIDDGSKRFSKRKPHHVVFDWERVQTMQAPVRGKRRTKPPAGYSLKLGPVVVNGETYGGFVCTGPRGKALSWPAVPKNAEEILDEPRLTPKAQKVTWLSASPPLAHVTASVKTPVGEKRSLDIYVMDCAAQVMSALPLSTGQWLIDGKVYGPSGPIGELPGEAPVAAP